LTNLGEYLNSIKDIVRRNEQQEWFVKLERTVKKGMDLYLSSSEEVQRRIWDELRNRARTEEIKAWYSEPEGRSLFQGTSVSSLTIPYEMPEPLRLNSIDDLEEKISESYIELHNRYAPQVRNAILENVDEWISQGLYYGVVICSKVISQAFGLSISHTDVIFEVDGYRVDPHEITSYPQEVREAYFEKCRNKVECFRGIDLEQVELEASLVLADISKPKIERYRDKIMLAPIRCNEIASVLSERIVERIIEKTSGKIMPKGLTVVIYDTDTPYTYHEIMGYSARSLSPVLPGLTVLGSSGTIDAFRWLYAYRISLITQKIQKGSLYSEAQKNFMPFVFFGVLVWRDAEILLDMNNLSRLRYRGNLSPHLEFAYMMSILCKEGGDITSAFSWEEFRKKHLFPA